MLELSWKFHPYWLAFIVLAGAIHTTRGESNHQYYSAFAINPTVIITLAIYSYGYNSGMEIVEVSNQPLSDCI